MSKTQPGYRNIRIGRLRQMARQGDAGAQQALEDFAGELARKTAPLHNINPVPRIRVPDLAFADHRMNAIAEAAQEAKRAEVAREEAMVSNLAAMRAAVERSEDRADEAEERAAQAEARERERAEAVLRREWVMIVMTLVATVSAVVAAVALFVT